MKRDLAEGRLFVLFSKFGVFQTFPRYRMSIRLKFTLPACLAATCVLMAQDPGAPQPPPAKVQTQPVPTKTIPNVPDDPSNGWSIGAIYWLTQGHSDLLPGKESTDPNAQHLRLPDADKRALGVRLTTPAGKYNRLVIEGWQAKGSGTQTATQDLTFFGTTFPQGDILENSYRVRNIKATWEYLMYPAPPQSAFRLRALFAMEYVGAKATISAPLDTTNNPYATGTRSIFLPTLGLGVDIVPSRNFRVEVRGSGFGWAGKSLILDADATLAVRVKHAEIVAGGKYFRYRTSPGKDEFLQGKLYGPHVGIRWVFGK
jgi:hypothetical protein